MTLKERILKELNGLDIDDSGKIIGQYLVAGEIEKATEDVAVKFAEWTQDYSKRDAWSKEIYWCHGEVKTIKQLFTIFKQETGL